MTDDDQPNHLLHYRKQMGLTQPQVAGLLGWKNIKAISMMESGNTEPTLKTALRLSAIYRTPVEFLYHDRYVKLRSEIREKEAKAASFGQQQELPLIFSHPDEPPPEDSFPEFPEDTLSQDCNPETLNI